MAKQLGPGAGDKAAVVTSRVSEHACVGRRKPRRRNLKRRERVRTSVRAAASNLNSTCPRLIPLDPQTGAGPPFASLHAFARDPSQVSPKRGMCQRACSTDLGGTRVSLPKFRPRPHGSEQRRNALELGEVGRGLSANGEVPNARRTFR